MAGLLAEAGLSGGHNQLVLEALGEETRLLRDLIVSGGLDYFSDIRVHMARQPLHADAIDPAGLADLLAEQGFRLQHTSDDADPDWPVLRFDRDAALFALRREAALLRRENDALRERAEQVAVAHAQALSERDVGIAALQAKTLDLAARFSSLETAASTEAARLSAEVRKWQDSREMVKDESARRLARAEDLEAQLAAVKAQFQGETAAQAAQTATLLSDAAGREAGLQADIAALRRELSAEKSISQNTGQRVAALTAELDSLRAAQHASETRAQAAQADLGLALRMQSLAASDMKDLQQRYAETLVRKEDQDRLIAQLVVRLEEASDYLQKLALPASQSGLSNAQTAQTTDLGRAQPVLAAKIKKTAKPGKAAKLDKSGKSGKAAR
jgi:chromosome segregation ATPase